MRAWPVLSFALLGTGCLSQVASLQPWCTEEQSVTLPGIVGTWSAEDDDGTTLRLEPAGDDAESKAYHLVIEEREKDEESQGEFVVAFTSIGEATYWNLTPLAADNEEGLWRAHRLSTHGFARIVLDGDHLEVAFLDPDWLSDALGAGQISVAHTRTDGDIVLTASTDELRELVAVCAGDAKAFANVSTFVRKAP
jgi:hypothetical protein